MAYVVLVVAIVFLGSLIDLHWAIKRALYKTSCWTLWRIPLFSRAFRRASPHGFWAFQFATIVYAACVCLICFIAGAALRNDWAAKLFTSITPGFIGDGMEWGAKHLSTPGELAICSAAFAFAWWFPQLLRTADTKSAGSAELPFLMNLLLSYQLMRRMVFVKQLFFHRPRHGEKPTGARRVPAIQEFAKSLLDEFRSAYPRDRFEREIRRIGTEMELPAGATDNQIFFEIIGAYGALYLYRRLESRAVAREQIAPIEVALAGTQSSLQVVVNDISRARNSLRWHVRALGLQAQPPEEMEACTMQLAAIQAHELTPTQEVKLEIATGSDNHRYLRPARKSDERSLWLILKAYC